MSLRTRSITLLIVCQVLAVTLWFSATAAVADLLERGLIAGQQAGLLTGAVQLGFVAGTLVSAWYGLADRIDPRRLFAAAAAAGAAANLAILAVGFDSDATLILRFATGAMLAGVYPVGMKIAAGWASGRGVGLLIGTLVGALTLGSALPHLVNAASGLDWRTTVLVSSGAAALAALGMAGVGLGPGHARSARFVPGEALAAIRRPALLLANGGYLGHMVELYAMWAWIGVFLTWGFANSGGLADPGGFAGAAGLADPGGPAAAGHLAEAGGPAGAGGIADAAGSAAADTPAGAAGANTAAGAAGADTAAGAAGAAPGPPLSASLLTFLVIASGGVGSILAGALADRIGRTTVTIAALAVSGTCAATIGLVPPLGPSVLIAVALVWGVTIVADSAQFSAAVSELAEPRLVGTMLTLQTSLGFLLTVFTIQAMPLLIEALTWRYAFAPLALGPALGALAMWRLRREPEAVKIAGGRR